MFNDDITKNIKATLYDRVTCPFISSYVTAWIVWNWRIILTLLSKLDYSAKLVAIENEIKPETYFVPFLGALIYVFIYPWFARGCFFSWQHYVTAKKNIKTNSEAKEKLSAEKANELRKELEAERTRYHDFVTEYEEREKILIGKKTAQDSMLSEYKKNLKDSIEKEQGLLERIEEIKETHTKAVNKVNTDISTIKKENNNLLAKEDTHKALQADFIKIIRGYEHPSFSSPGYISEIFGIIKYREKYEALIGKEQEKIKAIVKKSGVENVCMPNWKVPGMPTSPRLTKAVVLENLCKYYALNLLLSKHEIKKYTPET